MKIITGCSLLLPLLFACLAVPARAEAPIGAALRDLYSEKPEVRAAAISTLSSVASKPEIKKVIAGFKKELACAGKKPRPAKCHDPEFMRGVLLAAGGLAEKDSSLPWDFLVGLARGRTAAEGSFFQDKTRLEDQDFREDDYYSPGLKGAAANRAQLQKLLDEVINKAGISPSCDWPAAKIKSLGKMVQDHEGYQVYSYERDYSEAGLQEHYKVVYSQNWIFRGAGRVYCGPASRVSAFDKAGILALSVTDLSGEEPAYLAAVHDLQSGREICSYDVRVDSTEAAEILNLEEIGPEKLVSRLFILDKGSCLPRKIKGYSFTRAQ